MAAPPEPKRASGGKQAAEPDFSPFEDWLEDGPAGEWPEHWDAETALTEKQITLVAANAALPSAKKSPHFFPTFPPRAILA